MALASRKQSWVTVNMRLPPISEVPAKSPTSSSSSPRSSSTSKTRDTGNPFRRSSRRSSVSSTSSSLSDQSVTSQNSSVSPKAHRTSVGQNKRSYSINLTKSEEIIKQLEQRRRSSILNVMPDGRKASFRTVGARVTTLLKAKNAFAMLRKRRAQIEDDTVEDDKEFEIDQLPAKPRFASTLSAEAQYAMMKGYEDVVYSNLCRQYPEYRPMLRRNQTPLSGVTVKSVMKHCGNIFEKTKANEQIVKSNDGADDVAIDTVDSRDDSEPVSASTPKEDVSVTSSRQTLNTSPVPTLNSTDQSLCETQNISPLSRRTFNTEFASTKAKTKPEVQSKEKQLVMTYRYQRAMDILDSIRENQGIQPLSPRRKESRHIEPLKDYNSWSHVWTHEFEPKRALTNI
ncbi:uncharacterized protein LOC123558972 [Mercenaria mercenaria]|uniref:uncharacterized protein LOC123558972 n=1 Tax=Mercenaria mercenaria TaxID=6596 RepID=UPI00234F4102|nr:uncharacterized protein LOC123558972 [Mercenaria mercenaria]